jgi:hypothetical protein
MVLALFVLPGDVLEAASAGSFLAFKNRYCTCGRAYSTASDTFSVAGNILETMYPTIIAKAKEGASTSNSTK